MQNNQPLQSIASMESSRFTKFSQKIHAAAPTQIGVRWQWYKMISVYKNAALNNPTINTLVLAIFIIWNIVMSMYNFLITKDISYKSHQMFPFADIISSSSQASIAQYATFYISIFLTIATIIITVICVKKSDMLIYFQYIVSPNVQQILFPLHCICFSYIVSEFVIFNENDFYINVINVLYIIIFIVNTAFLSIHIYADNNSIIRPNTITAEWFNGITILSPLYTAFTTYISLQQSNLGSPAATVLRSIHLLFSVFLGLYIFYSHTFLEEIVNRVIMSFFATVAVLDVLLIISIWYDEISFDAVTILTPVMLCTFYIIANFLSKKKKYVRLQFLEQLNKIQGDYTLTTIMDILQPLSSERQVRTLIYEGIMEGNPVVTSYTFLQFFCERFKKSRWIVPYTAFLYAVKWGENPRTYRFLLSFLSTYANSDYTLQLYQALYCYAQTASSLSPVILRELDQHRSIMLQLATIHSLLWKSVLLSDNNNFLDYLLAYHIKSLELKASLKKLTIKYPYCPSIQIENGLFCADIKHDFVKSSIFYKHAQELLKKDRSSIRSSFRKDYFMIFPEQAERNNIPEELGEELKFLSMCDFQEHALRYNTIVSAGDEFLRLFTHSYSVPTNQPAVIVHFNSYYRGLALITFVIFIIVYIGFAINVFVIHNEFENKATEYHNFNNLISETIKFRTYLQYIRQDTRLIMNYYNWTYQDVLYNTTIWKTGNETLIDIMYGELINYTVKHLKFMETSLFQYRSYAYGFHTGVSYSQPGCDLPQCHMAYYNGALHQNILFFTRSETNTQDMIKRADQTLVDTVANLTEIIESVYMQLTALHQERINQYQRNDQIYLNISIVLNIFLLIVLIPTHAVSLQNLKMNIYDVLKTVQPDIINQVADCYDKLVDLDPGKRRFKKMHLTTIEILMLLAAFLILLLHNAAMWVMFANGAYLPPPAVLPALPGFNDVTQFMTYAVALMENYWDRYMKNVTDTTINYMVNAFRSEACIHYLFNTTCDNCLAVVKMYERYDSVSFWVMGIAFVLVSFVFAFTGFIYGIRNLQIPQTCSDVLKFLPIPARMSNPVISKIMIGGDPDLSVVNAFRAALEKPLKQQSFYCVFVIDEIGNITKAKGNYRQFFDTVPTTIEGILRACIQASPHDEEALTKFFSERPVLDTRSVSLGHEKEASLTFSRGGSILFIKNDEHHRVINDKMRKVEILQEAIKENQGRRTPSNIAECIIAILYSKKIETLSAVSKRLEPLGRIPDTRFFRVVLLGEIEKVEDIIKELKAIHDEFDDIKIVCTVGGPISIFNVSTTIEKTRVFGAPFKKARDMLDELPDHSISFLPEFIERFPVS